MDFNEAKKFVVDMYHKGQKEELFRRFRFLLGEKKHRDFSYSEIFENEGFLTALILFFAIVFGNHDDASLPAEVDERTRMIFECVINGNASCLTVPDKIVYFQCLHYLNSDFQEIIKRLAQPAPVVPAPKAIVCEDSSGEIDVSTSVSTVATPLTTDGNELSDDANDKDAEFYSMIKIKAQELAQKYGVVNGPRDTYECNEYIQEIYQYAFQTFPRGIDKLNGYKLAENVFGVMNDPNCWQLSCSVKMSLPLGDKFRNDSLNFLTDMHYKICYSEAEHLVGAIQNGELTLHEAISAHEYRSLYLTHIYSKIWGLNNGLLDCHTSALQNLLYQNFTDKESIRVIDKMIPYFEKECSCLTDTADDRRKLENEKEVSSVSQWMRSHGMTFIPDVYCNACPFDPTGAKYIAPWVDYDDSRYFSNYQNVCDVNPIGIYTGGWPMLKKTIREPAVKSVVPETKQIDDTAVDIDFTTCDSRISSSSVNVSYSGSLAAIHIDINTVDPTSASTLTEWEYFRLLQREARRLINLYSLLSPMKKSSDLIAYVKELAQYARTLSSRCECRITAFDVAETIIEQLRDYNCNQLSHAFKQAFLPGDPIRTAAMECLSTIHVAAFR